MKNKKEANVVNRTKSMAMSFFGPRPPKVPSTVTNPLPIQPTLFIPLKPTTTSHTTRLECVGTAPHNPEPICGCPVALQLLASLQKRIDSLPKDTTEAANDHPLAAFSGDPTGSVDNGEDAWEKWDGLLNTSSEESRRIGEAGGGWTARSWRLPLISLLSHI